MSDKEYPEKHRPRKLGTEKFDWYPTIPMEWYSMLATVDPPENESHEPEKKEEKA
jgi:hypothetical protein